MKQQKKTMKPGSVIHLYLGQRVFVPENGKTGLFHSFSLVPGQTDVIVDVHYSDAPDDWDVFNDNLEEFDRLKPILRRLRDITIEEAAHVLQQTFFDHITYPISDFKLTHVGDGANAKISIDNDWWSLNLIFGTVTGSIWSAENKSHNIKVPATVYAYLLSKGFDLFGLIDDGSAIDAKTLVSEGEQPKRQ